MSRAYIYFLFYLCLLYHLIKLLVKEYTRKEVSYKLLIKIQAELDTGQIIDTPSKLYF